MSDSTAPEATRSIFISYAHADADVARELRRELESRGLRASTADEVLVPGDRWAARLHDAVSSADFVVILVSEEGLNSPYVQLESAAAIAEAERHPTKRVIPVVIDPSVDPSGLLGSYQWLLASRADTASMAGSVAETVQRTQPVDKASDREEARVELERLERELQRERHVALEDQAKRLRRLARVLLLLMFASFAIVLALLFGLGNEDVLAAVLSLAASLVGVGVGYFVGQRGQDDG